MHDAAFDLIARGITQSAPITTTYSESGAATGGSGWLTFPAPLPSSPEHLWFFSYRSSQDARKLLLGFKDTTNRHGLSLDWSKSGDGAQRPRLKIIVNSGTFEYSMPLQALGDRLHLLVSQQIVGGNARTIAYLWNESSSSWAEVINATAGGGSATTFAYGTQSGTSLFAALGGQRRATLTSYRAAFWTAAELSSGLPDITQPTVQDSFTSGLHLADPATSHATFGTPLYDIHGPASVYNAGTNLGSGGDFTVNGSFT